MYIFPACICYCWQIESSDQWRHKADYNYNASWVTSCRQWPKGRSVLTVPPSSWSPPPEAWLFVLPFFVLTEVGHSQEDLLEPGNVHAEGDIVYFYGFLISHKSFRKSWSERNFLFTCAALSQQSRSVFTHCSKIKVLYPLQKNRVFSWWSWSERQLFPKLARIFS